MAEDKQEFTSIEFEPLNDQVLIKVHVQKKSALELDGTPPDKLPSGEVVAVGRGTFVDGKFVEPQVNTGDTVMFDLTAGPIIRVDITGDKEDFYAVMSEAQLLGKMHNMTMESHWFKKASWANG